ncbi:MAG: hypothetical protein ACREKE_10490 [bacterium]
MALTSSLDLMRQFIPFFAFALLLVAPLSAVGLGQGDSYAALGVLRAPLRLTWNLDPVTVRELGGGKGFVDDLMIAVGKRLSQAGVPIQDGSFDPLTEPYVCLDLWARGVERPKDPSDSQRVLDFEFQVFAPASHLRGVRHKGRIEVWQRGIFGVCGAADIRRQESACLGLCEAFAADWRAAHGIRSAPHRRSRVGVEARPTP